LRQFLTSVKVLRLDYGYSKRRVASAAGIAHSTYDQFEAGKAVPGVEVASRIAAALGCRLGFYLQPGSGPVLRDHLQAAMVQALLAMLHPRWMVELEKWVQTPVRGVIDVVLADDTAALAIATEAYSGLRRLEQQVRWSNAKADALALEHTRAEKSASTSRLLLLRSTPSNRQIVAAHANLIAAAYPARHDDALASLAGTAPWPGSAVVWCTVRRGEARILDSTPGSAHFGTARHGCGAHHESRPL
jgi:transcriptional regulator with XRE-family HTH domain